MEVAFRPYRRGDRDAVLALCIAAFAPIHAGFAAVLGPAIFRRQYGDWQGGYARRIDRWPADGDPRVHVAEARGRVVGFTETSLDTATGIGEIGLNAVDPAVQGRGIGRRMYRFALDELRVRGAAAATVGTGGDPAHAAARAAYAAVGFDRAIPALHLFREL